MSEHAWLFEENRSVRVKVLQRAAHATMVEYVELGMRRTILVSNDDLEFIGEQRLDDDED